MLAKSDRDVGEVLSWFARHDIECTLIVPTSTGIEKSIMDAIEPVRQYLKRRRVHDYATQPQGTGHKKIIRAKFLLKDREIEADASLYRPVTKKGDPRIWFTGLRRYARPNNLLAIIEHGRVLHVVNCSMPGLLESIRVSGSPLNRLQHALAPGLSVAAEELLSLLRGISRRGFIPSVRRGDTGIGKTLEDLLGITENSLRTPDYKGIEVKAARVGRRGARANRVNLFSQVPDWVHSRLKSGEDLLDEFGYMRAGRRQLYCTVNNKPNPQGLFFVVDPELLHNRAQEKRSTVDVVCWGLGKLKERLSEKHPETMWIKAQSRMGGRGVEAFHYVEAEHTRNPIVENLPLLLEAGVVTMDYTLSEKKNGRVRDHGYLFKIRPESLDALFPAKTRYDLT